MAFSVPELPYADDALAPQLGAQTLRRHHEIHRAHAEQASAALAGTGLEATGPRDLLRRLGELTPELGEHVAAHVNHTLLWESMIPGGSAAPAPGSRLGAAIRAAFGGMAVLAETLTQAAESQAGMGWAWLVHDGRRVLVVATAGEGCPLSDGLEPLLGIDVWAHAYELDYGARVADYVAAWLALVDWRVVEARLAAAPAPDVGDVLARRISVAGRDQPFGEVTADAARAHATELQALAGWGPTARVGAVARGWNDLAATLAERDAATVAELEPGLVEDAARALWIIPPTRSMV